MTARVPIELQGMHHIQLAIPPGVEVTWDDNFPGHERFYTFDQVGNRLEFLEPKQG